MSAATALRSARQAGVTIATDGDDLVLQAKAPPPQAIIEALRRHKTEIVALLTPATSGRAANACAAWDADDWLADFDERAGIAECDGGLNRLEAEALAFECCGALPSAPSTPLWGADEERQPVSVTGGRR
jgi:hypothetical protein